MADTIEEWVLETMKALGLKQKQIEMTKTGNASSMKKHLVDPEKTLPKVIMPGKPVPETKIGQSLAEKFFGSATERQTIDPKNTERIGKLHEAGTALPVVLPGNGRVLKGNFFSAMGHNLKGEDFKPDLSRPVVLLLTGGGGSAQDQGLDMAEKYTKGGASVLSVNFGGFGDSSKMQPSEKSINDDGQTMFKHLIAMGYKPEQIILHGVSMGSSVSAQLQIEYEKQGLKFRGQVQDRPLTDLSEKTKDHIGLGGGKDLLSKCDKLTRLVINTEDDKKSMKRGDKLREELTKLGHKQVSLASETEGSKGKETKTTSSDDPLLNLVRNDRSGKKDVDVSRARSDLETLVQTSVKDIFSLSQSIKNMIHEGRIKRDAKPLKAAREKIASCRKMISQLYDIELDQIQLFAKEFKALGQWLNKYDVYDIQIREGLKDILGFDEYVGDDLVSVSSESKELIDELNKSGGPSVANREIEEKLLALKKVGERAVIHIKQNKWENEFKVKYPSELKQFGVLVSVCSGILKSRKSDQRFMEERLSKLAEVSKSLRPQATEEHKLSIQANLKILKGEGEDVSAKRLVGKSSDKGFHAAVIKPVEDIVPKIEKLIEQGKEINMNSLPGLDIVFLGLNVAHKRYTEKLKNTDQKKDPKDWEQRNRKVLAIEKRMEGLNDLMTKANRSAESIEKIIQSKKTESLKELERIKGVGNAKYISELITHNLKVPPKDPKEALENQMQVKSQVSTLAQFLTNIDEHQLEEVLRNKLDPHALALAFIECNGDKDRTSRILLELFRDDPDYLDELAKAGIFFEFQRATNPGTVMRGNTQVTNLLSLIGSTGEGDEFSNKVGMDTLNELKGKKLSIKPLDPVDEKTLSEEQKKNAKNTNKRD